MEVWQIVLLSIAGGIVGLIALVAVLFVSWLLFAAICGKFVSTEKDHVKRSKLHCFIFETSLLIALFFTRVKVHVEGKEKVPTDKKFLMVGNHVSNYDSLATTKIFRKYHLGVISKPDNFKVPFFGRLTRACCYYPIDRDNPRKAVKTINLTAEVIKSGEASILVYPEGTRNKSAEGLLPFHNVVFKVAQKAACPIVVVGMRNTEKIHKRTPFRRTDVYLRVLEVIPVEEVLGVHTSEIGEKVAALLTEDEKAWKAQQNA